MKRIVLDPGHGGNGQFTKYGATGNGIHEKDLVLDLARSTREFLIRNCECEVVLTRDGDYDVPFAERAAFGRGADLLVSLHANGFHDPAAHGFESFIFNGTVSAVTAGYQKILHAEIMNYLGSQGMRDRGMKRENFYMLRVPPCPCILPEYLFVTNARDAAVFNESGQREVAKATALGIIRTLDLPKKPEEKLPEIRRRINVEVNGNMTDEPAYLINNATYVRAAFITDLVGVQTTGHGDHIKVKTQ